MNTDTKSKLKSNSNFNMVTKTLNLHNGLSPAKKKEVLSYFTDTFDQYESLFDCLANEEAYYVKPNTLRHPLIFYFAHTAVFYINRLNLAGALKARINKKMEIMMSVGVDEMSWDDLDESNYDWPTVNEVREYRKQVRDLVCEFINETSLLIPIKEENPFWIIMMGIEHERIHLETSTVLIREHDLKYIKEAKPWTVLNSSKEDVPNNTLVDIKGVSKKLGVGKEYPYYHWDNEFGDKFVEVKDFKASQFLVSNREYLEFVKDDGYSQNEFWSEEGQKWLKFSNYKMPKFWKTKNNEYAYRAMLKEIDMPWSWPAEVNCLEAEAFCNWKSKKEGAKYRLPLESEWYAMAEAVKEEQPLWSKAPGNINLEYNCSPTCVDKFRFSNGLYDVIGNVWQWCGDAIDKFEGYHTHKAYYDFSIHTFDGKHNLIKGGSWVSTGNLSLTQSRYAFRRHFFQHSGFRYVTSESTK